MTSVHRDGVLSGTHRTWRVFFLELVLLITPVGIEKIKHLVAKFRSATSWFQGTKFPCTSPSCPRSAGVFFYDGHHPLYGACQRTSMFYLLYVKSKVLVFCGLYVSLYGYPLSVSGIDRKLRSRRLICAVSECTSWSHEEP